MPHCYLQWLPISLGVKLKLITVAHETLPSLILRCLSPNTSPHLDYFSVTVLTSCSSSSYPNISCLWTSVLALPLAQNAFPGLTYLLDFLPLKTQLFAPIIHLSEAFSCHYVCLELQPSAYFLCLTFLLSTYNYLTYRHYTFNLFGDNLLPH